MLFDLPLSEFLIFFLDFNIWTNSKKDVVVDSENFCIASPCLFLRFSLSSIYLKSEIKSLKKWSEQNNHFHKTTLFFTFIFATVAVVTVSIISKVIEWNYISNHNQSSRECYNKFYYMGIHIMHADMQYPYLPPCLDSNEKFYFKLKIIANFECLLWNKRKIEVRK